MCNPSFPISKDVWRNHDDLIAGYNLQETFRAGQRVLLEKELIGIKENSKWSEEEKSKKASAASYRLMTAQVCVYAVSLQLPVLHFHPIILTQFMVICSLHIDCNEWSRVFERYFCYRLMSVWKRPAPDSGTALGKGRLPTKQELLTL